MHQRVVFLQQPADSNDRYRELERPNFEIPGLRSAYGSLSVVQCVIHCALSIVHSLAIALCNK